MVNLEPVVGSEQGQMRPVLVLSSSALNGLLPVVNAAPITSRKANRRVYRNEALLPAGTAGLPMESIVLCYQIRALDKRRLGRFFGLLTDVALQEAVMEALKYQLVFT